MIRNLIVSAAWLLTACGNNGIQPAKSSGSGPSIVDTIAVESKIVGWWIISTQTTNGVREKCNICPKVWLSQENTGKILMPSKEEHAFKYSLHNDVINFYVDSITNYFDDKSGYYYIFSDSVCNLMELHSVSGEINYEFYRNVSEE